MEPERRASYRHRAAVSFVVHLVLDIIGPHFPDFAVAGIFACTVSVGLKSPEYKGLDYIFDVLVPECRADLGKMARVGKFVDGLEVEVLESLAALRTDCHVGKEGFDKGREEAEVFPDETVVDAGSVL